MNSACLREERLKMTSLENHCPSASRWLTRSMSGDKVSEYSVNNIEIGVIITET